MTRLTSFLRYISRHAPTMARPAATLRTGAQMPLLGLGTGPGSVGSWQTSTEPIYEAVKVAIDTGYRHIDTAESYADEKAVGKALQEKIGSAVERKDMFITSKLWNTRHHPDDVLPACQRSLTDLGLDYLDLYLMHFPVAWTRGDVYYPKDDNGRAILCTPDVPFMDTWKAMENLVDAGLVKAIGVSNFNISQMEEVLTNGRIKPAVNQVESHPYLVCSKLLKCAAENDVVITAYSPLGRPGEAGLHGVTPFKDPKVISIAEKHNKTPAQVCLRWQVQRGVVIVPKSVTPARILENSQIFDFELSAEEMETISGLNKDARIVKFGMCDDHPQWPFNGAF
ncbi:AKR1A1 [Branchiostoma lanceolatum]|uniref:alcohol dehydrogenase (NADP(+)) n=2 Tax=Branchiostoma lanceolatum TaxID=7740 RepID=A0A8J9ZCL6_BRALA|nr:AKR1A1 [Branchiostoma lanceolatum]